MSEMTIDEMVNSYKQSQGSKMSVDDMASSYKMANKKQNAIQKIADSGLVTNLNQMGDFVTDASLTAGMDFLGGVANLFPFGGQKEFLEHVKNQNDYFSNKYGQDSYASGFKDALADSAIALTPAGIEAKGWEMLAKSPRTLKSIAKALTSYAAPRAAQGGIIGVEMGNNEGNKLGQFAGGGALNLGVSGALGGAGKVSKSILNKIGNANAKEIEEALGVIKNEHGEIPATGGEILNSPQLKQFQKNILAYIPGAGQMAKAQKISRSLGDQASKIWQGLIGDKDKDLILSDLKESVMDRYFKAYKQADVDYDKGIDYLRKNGFGIKNDKTVAQAKKKLSEYMSDVKQEPILKNPELESILKDYSSLGEEGVSYEAAKSAKSKLFDAMKNSEDAYTRGVINDLYKARKADLENTGDDYSKLLFQLADENFKKNVAPFKEKEVSKFIYEKMSPKQMFTKFIKSANAEDPEKVKILAGMLDDNEKKMMAAEILKSGGAINENGSINFTRMANKWKNLGPHTKNAFFTEGQINGLNDLLKKRDLSQSALESIVNPNTGIATTRAEAFSNTMKAIAALSLGIWRPKEAAKAASMLGGANVLQKVINSPAALRFLANLRSHQQNNINGAPFLSAAIMENNQ